MNPRKRKHHRVSSHYWGWTASTLCFAVAGEAFVLTSLFIERDYRQLAFWGAGPAFVKRTSRDLALRTPGYSPRASIFGFSYTSSSPGYLNRSLNLPLSAANAHTRLSPAGNVWGSRRKMVSANALSALIHSHPALSNAFITSGRKSASSGR